MMKKCLEVKSSKWVKLVDRGGLIHITDDCFQLFLAIETATRQEFHLRKVPKMDDTFCQHVIKVVVDDHDVLFSWTRINGGETDKEILQITVRGHSFTKTVMEHYRQDTKKRIAKSKGLRTKLLTEEVHI